MVSGHCGTLTDAGWHSTARQPARACSRLSRSCGESVSSARAEKRWVRRAAVLAAVGPRRAEAESRVTIAARRRSNGKGSVSIELDIALLKGALPGQQTGKGWMLRTAPGCKGGWLPAIRLGGWLKRIRRLRVETNKNYYRLCKTEMQAHSGEYEIVRCGGSIKPGFATVNRKYGRKIELLNGGVADDATFRRPA